MQPGAGAPVADIELRIHRRAPTRSGVAAFSVVRNELPLLRHLLPHHRALGVQEFWFLDDRSTDGTREFLCSQPDCSVLSANLRFADTVGNRRFGIHARELVPRTFLTGRWVLTLDADEFVQLPPAYPDLPALTRALDANGLRVARALMLDFFPRTLADLAVPEGGRTPFEIAPFTDGLSEVVWPAGQGLPTKLSVREAIRPRLAEELLRRGFGHELPAGYRNASIHKVPLLKWDKDTRLMSAHRCSVPPSDAVQLVLAHFKFMPGLEGRIADAIATGAYYGASQEYRFLQVAMRELRDWPLAGPRTIRWEGPQTLADAGLVYARF